MYYAKPFNAVSVVFFKTTPNNTKTGGNKSKMTVWVDESRLHNYSLYAIYMHRLRTLKINFPLQLFSFH